MTRLAAKGDMNVISPILCRLEDKDREIRDAAVNALLALSESGNQAVITAMTARLDGEDMEQKF